MNRRHFSALLMAVVVVAIAVVLLVPDRTGQNGMSVESLFLPELGARINEAGKLVLTAGGGELLTTLEKGDQRWIIAELDNYPADWSRSRERHAAAAAANSAGTSGANCRRS